MNRTVPRRGSPCGALLGLLAVAAAASCTSERTDAATLVAIDASGSLQNATFSPGGDELLITRFREGYNEEPADLLVVSIESGAIRTLVSDGSGNVNLPGSAWNEPTGQVVFSSSREPHDEIFLVAADGAPGNETALTSRSDRVAYEPSFAPDGQTVVFEAHPVDVEGEGVITTYRLDGAGGYVDLTRPEDDCRQPNWSPRGDWIVCQCLAGGRLELFLLSPDGAERRQVTSGSGDKTDASFSPDGARLVYSADGDDLEHANLFVVGVDGGEPLRVTAWDGYDGAPSWSPDGTRLAFESYGGDPDGSDGTAIWLVDAP